MDEVLYELKSPFESLFNGVMESVTAIVLFPPRANQYATTAAIRAEFNAAITRSNSQAMELKAFAESSGLDVTAAAEEPDENEQRYSADDVQRTLDMGGADYAAMADHLVALLKAQAELVSVGGQRGKFEDGPMMKMAAADLEGLLVTYIANFLIASWMQKTG